MIFQTHATYHPVEPDAVLPPGVELWGRGSLRMGMDVLPGTPDRDWVTPRAFGWGDGDVVSLVPESL